MHTTRVLKSKSYVTTNTKRHYWRTSDELAHPVTVRSTRPA